MPPAPLSSGPLERQSPFPWKPLILGALIVLLAGVIWIQFQRAQEVLAIPAQTLPKKKPPKATRSHPPAGPDSAHSATPSPGATPTNGATPAPGAVPSSSGVTGGSEAGSSADPGDLEAWSFTRVRWERPDSRELAERVNRLGEGFDHRPVGRFHVVRGRYVFLRVSTLVNPSPDRVMDRIPESAIVEYLPEWYQRGFIIHRKGPFHRFSPRLFRLRHLPGWMPDTTAAGRDRPLRYQVQALVEEEGALLLYPDARDREGDNGFREPEEFLADAAGSPFTAAYFRTLTRGKVEAVRTYDFPDRGFGLVEVLARRRAPAGLAAKSPEDSVRTRNGAWLFLVKPSERRIAFLAHDFDGRFCLEDKQIRFRGTLDVDGDDHGELLLGPRPTFLVHEDPDGLKYHFEDGYKCSQ